MIETDSVELMKNRGYGSLLIAAFKTVTADFKHIIKHQWPYATAYALVMAYAAIRFINDLRADVTEPSVHWVEVGIIMLLVFAVDTAFTGRAAMLVNGMSIKPSMLRSLRLNIFIVVLKALVLVIMAAAMIAVTKLTDADAFIVSFTGYSATAALAVWLIAVMAAIPYIYSAPKYMVETRAKVRGLIISGYGTGGKHWGYIFITMLLLCIVTGAVVLLISIPMIVLVCALGMAVAGLAMGDDLGLPGYFYPMMYGVGTVTFFIISMVNLYRMFVVYYLYGSIEIRTKEKAALLKSNEKQR